MIASLQMYDWPELAASYRTYWGLIRDTLKQSGHGAPEELTHVADERSVWLRDDLVLSQTCGMPYRLALHGKVTLIGTPDYGVRDCPPGCYRSVFVVRRDDSRSELADFQNAKFAFNNQHSQSGYAAAYFHTTELGFWFSNQSASGSHKESARLVAAKSADIASIDAVSWRFMERYDDFAETLRVVAWTKPTPGLPYISARGCDRRVLFDAIQTAIDALPEPDQKKLCLDSLVDIPETDYLAIPNP